MAKYNKKTVNTICKLIKKDSYTNEEICKLVGISEEIFYRWKRNKVEFVEALEKAKKGFDENILVECEKSLVKLICGYDYEETKTILVNDGSNNPKIKEKSTTKKHVPPNLGALIHFQSNKDPENWKNRQSIEATGKDGKDLFNSIDLSKLSEEELKQYHLLLTKASAKE